jgi:hypothetical protein
MSCVQVSPDDTRTKDVLCVAFNDKATVFAVGTLTGFAVYSAEPFMLLRQRSVPGGVKYIALYSEFNVLALVPARKNNEVWLWNDLIDDPEATPEVTEGDDVTVTVGPGAARFAAPHRSSSASASVDHNDPDAAAQAGDRHKPTAAAGATSNAAHAQSAASRTPANVVAKAELDAPVKALRLHKRCIAVGTTHNVRLYDSSLRHVWIWEIDPVASSHIGMASLDTGATVQMAIPGPSTGTVALIEYTDRPQLPTGVKPAGGGQLTHSMVLASTSHGKVNAAALAAGLHVAPRDYLPAHHENPFKQITCAPHHSTIGALAMSHNGQHVVTASIHGTALKLLETRSGNVLTQFNRGTTTNRVQSLCFNSAGSLIAAATETGTVHLFSTGTTSKQTDAVHAVNPRSMLTNLAQTVGDNSSFGGGSRVRDAVSFAKGEFAFATFPINQCDESDHRRVFKGSIVALRQGVHHGRATMYVGQCDWGRLFKVAVDVTQSGDAVGVDVTGKPTRCLLQWTARFPEQEL